jgi:hypothetical protein
MAVPQVALLTPVEGIGKTSAHALNFVRPTTWVADDSRVVLFCVRRGLCGGLRRAHSTDPAAISRGLRDDVDGPPRLTTRFTAMLRLELLLTELSFADSDVLFRVHASQRLSFPVGPPNTDSFYALR